MVWIPPMMKKHRRRSTSSRSPSSSNPSPERERERSLTPTSTKFESIGGGGVEVGEAAAAAASEAGSSGRSSPNRLSTRTLFFGGGGSKHKRRLFMKQSSITESCSLSSTSSSGQTTDGAPWRIENIRDSAPTEQEWWDDDTVLHPGAGRVSCGGGVMFKAISTGVASGDGCSSDVNTTMLTAADISYEGDEREGEAEAGAEAPVSDFHAMITNPIASTMAAFFSSSTEPSSQPQARPSTDRSSEQRSQEHDPQSHQRTTTLTRTKRFHNVGLETWLRVREEWKQRTVVTLPPRPTPAEHAQLVRSLKRHSTLRTYELPRRMVLSDLIAVYQDIWDGGEL